MGVEKDRLPCKVFANECLPLVEQKKESGGRHNMQPATCALCIEPNVNCEQAWRNEQDREAKMSATDYIVNENNNKHRKAITIIITENKANAGGDARTPLLATGAAS